VGLNLAVEIVAVLGHRLDDPEATFGQRRAARRPRQPFPLGVLVADDLQTLVPVRAPAALRHQMELDLPCRLSGSTMRSMSASPLRVQVKSSGFPSKNGPSSWLMSEPRKPSERFAGLTARTRRRAGTNAQVESRLSASR